MSDVSCVLCVLCVGVSLGRPRPTCTRAASKHHLHTSSPMAPNVSLIFTNKDKNKLEETADKKKGIMEWTGQNCHRKDHLVGEGTLIFYRTDKKEFSFIGKVVYVVLIEEGDKRAQEPNKYKFFFEKCDPPEGLRTSKQRGESFYHIPILLSLGFDAPTWPEGVYAR